jgi:hypothetical protein
MSATSNHGISSVLEEPIPGYARAKSNRSHAKFGDSQEHMQGTLVTTLSSSGIIMTLL